MRYGKIAFAIFFAALLGIVFFNPLALLAGDILSVGTAKSTVDAYPAKLRTYFVNHGYRYLPYAQIPECAKEGIVSVEDKRFFSNPGIDIVAIFRVLAMSFVNDHTDHGGSTLTQQLARLIIHEPRAEPNVWAAVSGMANVLRYTLVVNHEFSKQKVLELYLNTVYYGRDAHGLAQAARAYFHKDIHDLSFGQCVYLTGLPQAPSVFGNNPTGALATHRYDHVLATLTHNHYITTKEEAPLVTAKLFTAQLTKQ